jgi:hypothetical protein
MFRLLLAAAGAAILLLLASFVPIGGKTLLDRWNTAPSATQVASRGWNAVVSGWDRLWGVKPTARPPARPGARSGGPGRVAQGSSPSPGPKPAPEPQEHHTEADRTAIDRIVAEHAADRPAPRP